MWTLPLKESRMPGFALIACRVTSETKARVRRLAERDGITESTLLRQLLDVVLRTAGLRVHGMTATAQGTVPGRAGRPCSAARR